jgi:hypothetical protein
MTCIYALSGQALSTLHSNDFNRIDADAEYILPGNDSLNGAIVRNNRQIRKYDASMAVPVMCNCMVL